MTDVPSRVIGRGAGLLFQLIAGAIVLVGLLAATEFISGLFVPRETVPDRRAIVFKVAADDTLSQGINNLDLNPVPTAQDIDLVWNNKPSSTKVQPVNPQGYGRKDTWAIRINSEGFRGSEREFKDAGNDVYRVLFIGDSVTYGYSVEEADSFVRRVEAALQARYPRYRFDIVNAGVPGWSWVQGLRFLQLRGMALHPHLVVMAHGMNDQFFPAKITDNERIRALDRPSARTFERVRELVSDTNMFRLASRLVRRSSTVEVESPGCARQIREAGGCRRVGLYEIEEAVHEAHALAVAGGSDFLVLNLDFEETPAVGAVRKAVDRDGIRFVDFASTFDAMRQAEQDRRAQQLGLGRAHMVRASSEQAAKGGGQVLLRVVTGSVAGRFSVRGFAFPFVDAFHFDQPLFDDGTHGDEISNDHVMSTIVNVPTGIPIVHYRYYVDDTPEFVSPPRALQSIQGYREIRPKGESFAPIDEFGQQFLMVERTHPNAQGHEVIAAGVLDAIGAIKSFSDFVGERRAEGSN